MSDAGDISVPVKSEVGSDVKSVSVAASSLDSHVRYSLIKEVIVAYEENRRNGTHNAKTRAEIVGTTQKPWRQKGTGRARSGTRKSPLWRGGGVVFGPRPRDYTTPANRKKKQLALKSAILTKFRAGKVLVLEGLDLPEPKTRALGRALKACGVDRSCLIGLAEPDRNVVLSARNLPRVQVAAVKDWNARDVMRAESLVLLPGALEQITGK